MLFADVDNGDDGTASLWPLVHGIDRNEDCRVADRRSCDAADRAFRMAMVVDVRVIEHDLTASAQDAAAIRLAFHEAVDELSVQVAGARTLGQRQAWVADRVINAIDVECVLHHRMADAVSAAGTGPVALKDDLRLGQLDAGRAP